MKVILVLLLVISCFGLQIDTIFVFRDGFLPRHIVGDGISGVYVVSGMRSELVHIDGGEIRLRQSLPGEMEIADITRSGLEIILASENTGELLYFNKRLIHTGNTTLEYNNEEIFPSMIFATASRRLFILDEFNSRLYIKDGDNIQFLRHTNSKKVGKYPKKNGIVLYDEKAELIFDIARSDSSIVLPDGFEADFFIANNRAIYSVSGKKLRIYYHNSNDISNFVFSNSIIDMDMSFGFLYLLSEKYIFRLAIE